LGLPLLKRLGDGKPNVLGDVAQQSRGDVAAGVKWNSAAMSGTVAKLLVGSTLAHLDESQLVQDRDDFSRFPYRDVSHVSRDRNVLHPDKL
jgi:hypothetical protein